MISHAAIVAVTVVTVMSPLAALAQDAGAAATEAKVREILNMEEPKGNALALVRLGAQVFPTYEKILTDPRSSGLEVSGIFQILRGVEADRRRFVEHAARHLADPDASVRLAAAALLGRIGGRSEASPIVALLWDEDVTVVYAVAEALAAIGGDREVTAFDIWIKSGNHRGNGDLRRHVQQCRDALQRKVADQKRSITG